MSGRPAQFNAGGEIPILVPQSLGTSSVEYKKFGTQVDFLPIVLGNGNIRLEVRPRISEIDDSRSVTILDSVIPSLKVREVDTAVEMKAGQTFALAGLIQEREEGINRGLPVLADMPVFGVPFRRVENEVNEIELLILVTPEFVDAMEPYEVPCGGPGMDTVSPSNAALYLGGHMEVPAHCNPIRGSHACGDASCGACGGAQAISTDGGVIMPGGTGYGDGAPYEVVEPAPAGSDGSHGELIMPSGPQMEMPDGSAMQQGGGRPYSPGRHPHYVRNAARPHNPNAAGRHADTAGGAPVENLPALIGPVGYDVQ